MLQHVLLGDIAPLLLLLSLSRVMLRPVTRRLMGIERALGPLASPVTAILIWVGTMYLWHIPALYDAALEHSLVHVLEHFSSSRPASPCGGRWSSRSRCGARSPGSSRSPTSPPPRAASPPSGWCSRGAPRRSIRSTRSVPRIWDLSAVEDQNVAGVIMMVEQSMTLVLVLVWVFVRMLTRSEEDELPARALGGGSSSRVERRCDQHRALTPRGPCPQSACIHIQPHPRSPPLRRPARPGTGPYSS